MGPPSSPGLGNLPDLAVVARRIAEAIAAAESAAPEARPRAIVFRVGGNRIALPLTSIREVVVPPSKLSRVPRAPEAILGIMNLRGRVVAVVDLAYIMPASSLRGGMPHVPGAQLATGRVLLLEHARREIGLLVSEVEGISAVADAEAQLLDVAQLAAALEALVS